MATYTSEFVTKGHADKVCDQISDAVLDECLRQDPDSRVALETVVKAGERSFKTMGDYNFSLSTLPSEYRIKDGWVHLAGEITTKASLNLEKIARVTINSIGYHSIDDGINPASCLVTSHVTGQSQDISRGVTATDRHEQGAGDQGMMYGYACNETPSFMPLSYEVARQLCRRLEEVRENGALPWLRPDGKSQATLRRSRNGWVLENITLAAQHSPDVDNIPLKLELLDRVVKPVLEIYNLEELPKKAKINGTGRFEIGGPLGDSGVTGRKIIVDTYGGRARHGGGAFSGKDPSKVDRSAAYMARHVAKSIVANDLAEECEVSFAYTIGQAKPDNFTVTTDRGDDHDSGLVKMIQERFDFRPAAIVEYLNLKRPIYLVTASGGHFGRDYNEKTGEFSWEKVADLS